MKIILEIKDHAGSENVTRHTTSTFPVTIGRGFDNDIIIGDPHVNARHLVIDFENNSLLASDLQSINGLYINGIKHPVKTPVSSGSTLRIGQTEIRLFTADHAVAEAAPLQKSSSVFYWLSRSRNVWCCIFAAMSLMLCLSYLQTSTEEIGRPLSGAATITLAILIFWSALWAVAGRLIKNKAHFKSHVAVISIYLIAWMVSWYVNAYVDFISNENWIASVVSYGLNFITLSFLLYGSLTLATQMNQKKRQIASGFFSFGVISAIVLLGFIGDKGFQQQPLYPATLQPYLSGLAPAKTLPEFIESSEKMFIRETFKTN